MDKYYPPEHEAKQFNCPYCGVYAAQGWATAHIFSGYQHSFQFSRCEHCWKMSCWHEGVMIVPSDAPVPTPHRLMPDECKAVYEEGREIAAKSPKAAAALIRLTLQLLMKALGEKGDHIDKDIQSLVDKGLDTHIQEALDYCRVVGNHAVHPGVIQLDDDPNIAYMLFEMINLIVEDRIARPARVRAAVAKLPEEARNKIEARAAKK